MFSILAKKGTNRLFVVLPKGNQLYSIFLITANPVLDKTQHNQLVGVHVILSAQFSKFLFQTGFVAKKRINGAFGFKVR
jgi:hypothetical protein